MYDKEIVELEEELGAATQLIRFFKAYLRSQPGYQIKVKDWAVQEVSDNMNIEVFRDNAAPGTIIGLQ